MFYIRSFIILSRFLYLESEISGSINQQQVTISNICKLNCSEKSIHYIFKQYYNCLLKIINNSNDIQCQINELKIILQKTQPSLNRFFKDTNSMEIENIQSNFNDPLNNLRNEIHFLIGYLLFNKKNYEKANFHFNECNKNNYRYFDSISMSSICLFNQVIRKNLKN